MAYERVGLDRRTFLSASAALTVEMLASIAGGDDVWLSRNIAPYDFSVSLATLANRDQGTKRRLLRWLHDGSTSLLRGNAQGTLFETRCPELIELAELAFAVGAAERVLTDQIGIRHREHARSEAIDRLTQ